MTLHAIGPTRRGKGTKTVAFAADNSLPLAVTVESASPAECQLVDELPARLLGDKAYDSDGLNRKLAEDYGIEMIAPNRRKRSRTQDGRPLRRYKKGWKSRAPLRMDAQLRRLVNRWEYHIENLLGMVHLACPTMLLRHFA